MARSPDERVIPSDAQRLSTERVEGPAVAFDSVRRHKSLLTNWIKVGQASLLALAVCFSLGATDAGTRFNDLGHRLMCTCGCAQLLGECDHVGCPDRGEEMSLLSTAIAAGETDEQILDDFSGKYGLTVLAAPPAHGFNLVAWIAPFAVFAAALVGTILLIRRWGGTLGNTQASASAPGSNEERSRIERVRRETGMGAGSDGGF
jgi:cytochrome c-type biogenesis protein CcmH/NrfF